MVEYIVAIDVTRVRFPADAHGHIAVRNVSAKYITYHAPCITLHRAKLPNASRQITGLLAFHISIGGLILEYIVAIDVTRVRFPADAIRVMPW